MINNDTSLILGVINVAPEYFFQLSPLGSIITGLIATIIGSYSIYRSHATGILTSAGTASLFTIAVIVSVQLLFAFIYYDCTIRLIFRQKD